MNMYIKNIFSCALDAIYYCNIHVHATMCNYICIYVTNKYMYMYININIVYFIIPACIIKSITHWQ